MMDINMELLGRVADVHAAADALVDGVGEERLNDALVSLVAVMDASSESAPAALRAIAAFHEAGRDVWSGGAALVAAVARGMERVLLEPGDVQATEELRAAEEDLVEYGAHREGGSGTPPVAAETGGATGSSIAEDHDVTLDGVAAFLIQMEPTLVASLEVLRDRLRAVVDGWKGSRETAEHLSGTLEDLESVLSNSRSRKARRVEAVEKVSHALEAAILEVEDMESGVSRGSDPEAGDGSPDAHRTNPGSAAVSAEAAPEGAAELALSADPQLVLDFVSEGLEYLDEAEQALLVLETTPAAREAVDVVFRAFHTIKGVSAFLEFNDVSDIAHEAETLLALVREGEVSFTSSAADLFLESADVLRELILGIRETVGGGSATPPSGLSRLVGLLRDPTLPQRVARNESLGLRSTEKPQAPTEALSSQCGSPAVGTSDSSVRIRTDRLDRLVDLVGELVIAHSMIAQDSLVLSDRGDLTRKVGRSHKILRELQDLSTSLRMVPLKPAFHKISRVVRDVSRKSGKRVELVTEGGETELDRSMVGVITDPLVHMVRNAIDHGIEDPEGRRAAGKPEQGRLTLAAKHSGGNVVVEIEDDGCGLDREAILAKAVAQGLVDPDRTLADEEVFSLIFRPGLSTVQQVTDLSGRGVGMDVVKRAVGSLRGRIEIDSRPGRGTRFSISLPLTLAITDGMLVRVGKERYIIPTMKIQLSFRPTEEDLWTVAGRGEMVMLHGQLIPVARLHRLFDVTGCQKDPREAILVVVGEGSRRTALLVDELLGQQQFVVKPLNGQVAGTAGVSGGAILGDGGVGLILDPEGIIGLSRNSSGQRHPEAA